jgi:fructose-bisphosphate aldolase class II
VSDNDIKQGIRTGLSKVNIATQLNQAFTAAIRDVLDRDGELVDPRKYLAGGRSAQTEIVRERIRFLDASGKAG